MSMSSGCGWGGRGIRFWMGVGRTGELASLPVEFEDEGGMLGTVEDAMSCAGEAATAFSTRGAINEDK